VTLRALALIIASILHPGAERWARGPVTIAADVVEAERVPHWSRPFLLAIVLEWEWAESDFGRRRHSGAAPCDWGLMQLHGRPDLEGPAGDRESVRVWLALLRANATACGWSRATAGLSSGRCDQAVRFADAREQDAALVLELAR
jgi:hypothetical protein